MFSHTLSHALSIFFTDLPLTSTTISSAKACTLYSSVSSTLSNISSVIKSHNAGPRSCGHPASVLQFHSYVFISLSFKYSLIISINLPSLHFLSIIFTIPSCLAVLKALHISSVTIIVWYFSFLFYFILSVTLSIAPIALFPFLNPNCLWSHLPFSFINSVII